MSLKMMSKHWQEEDQGFLVELRDLSLNAAQSDIVDNGIGTEVTEILNQFNDVFDLPPGLPPPREVDHQIVLHEGQGPVNVRLYKSEIEKLIREMLASGIICPSGSPFSSPVLLVKKDGGW